MKSQAAIEYMIVVTIALLFLTPFFLMAQQSIKNMDNSIKLIEAKEAIEKIAEATRIVYAQGDPAKLTISVKFPKDIVSTNVINYIILINVQSESINNSIFKVFDFEVTGSLPSTYGTHMIALSNINNTVNISYTE